MKRLLVAAIVALVVAPLMVVSSAQARNCHRVPGEIGSSSRWGSGWLDLAPVTDFRKGESLRLSIGGSAKKVLVRLLRRGESPDDSVGILDEYAVPPSRTLEVMLKEAYKAVKQISVHGGPNPWGNYPLGGGNGPATLKSVERCSP